VNVVNDPLERGCRRLATFSRYETRDAGDHSHPPSLHCGFFRLCGEAVNVNPMTRIFTIAPHVNFRTAGIDGEADEAAVETGELDTFFGDIELQDQRKVTVVKTPHQCRNVLLHVVG